MSTPGQSEQNFIGIDLSGPTIRANVIDAEGKTLETLEVPKEKQRTVEQVAHITNNFQIRNKQISAIGIAIPGLVNRQIDRVVVSRDLPDTVREDLHLELSKATGLRVEIESDLRHTGHAAGRIVAHIQKHQSRSYRWRNGMSHYTHRGPRLYLWQFWLSGNRGVGPKYSAARQRSTLQG